MSRIQLTEFFEMYRHFTCLWKVKSKDYLDRSAKKQAIEALTKKYQEIEENVTEDFVRKKINNYRTSYKRERRLVQAGRKSGAGAEDLFTSKLWYYNLLEFLDEQDIPRPSTSNIYQEEEANESQVITQEVLEDADYPEPSPTSTIQENSDDTRQTYTQTPLSSKKETPMPRKRQKKCDGTENLLNTINARLLQKASETEQKKDRYDILCENMAIKLRSVSDQQRIVAEKLMNDVLYEAECNNLNRNWRLVECNSANNVGTMYTNLHATNNTDAMNYYNMQRL